MITFLLTVAVIVAVPSVFIGWPVASMYMRERFRRQNIALQHQRRLQRLNKVEDVIQLLIADKELGGAIYQRLDEQYGPRLLPPPPTPHLVVRARAPKVKKTTRKKRS